ncbi:MAG: D-alanyl-D-alanine carboxypeptidase/D-alanyl-D-alanine-endopeptidase, partial [Myxococcota bacterium]
MRRLWIAIVIVLLLGAPQVAAREVSQRRSLAQRLDSVLGEAPLRRARVSALVVRDRDGAVIYAHEPDRPLIPASNLKILTAMAALDTFGPAHRFETRVLATASPDAAGAVGDVFLVGGGDPVLNSEDWWRLAAELRQLGVREVKGNIVVDDSIFDGERWHPSWGETSSRAYHAPIGGLTANYGSFSVTVIAGSEPGDAVDVVVDPPIPYFAISNRAITGSRR